MPATAVGNAKGRSTSASRMRRPGNRYRTRTHASSKPNTALIKAPISDAPKERRSEASTRGAVTIAQNASQPSVADLKNVAESGIRTISDRYSTVYPIGQAEPRQDAGAPPLPETCRTRYRRAHCRASEVPGRSPRQVSACRRSNRVPAGRSAPKNAPGRTSRRGRSANPVVG